MLRETLRETLHEALSGGSVFGCASRQIKGTVEKNSFLGRQLTVSFNVTGKRGIGQAAHIIFEADRVETWRPASLSPEHLPVVLPMPNTKQNSIIRNTKIASIGRAEMGAAVSRHDFNQSY